MGTDKTKWIFDDDKGAEGFTESIARTDFGEPTVRDDRTADGATSEAGQREQTVIFHRGTAERAAGEHGFDEALGPVCGWLVVEDGPGRGRSVSLGAGLNTIGRDPAQRAALPFGDLLISQRDHARIYYDDEERAFHIDHGTGKNITRLNGKLLTGARPLENYAVIQLTKATRLRFVALCGEQFDWSDVAGEGDSAAQ